VVPVGGFEITGVFVVVLFLLHAANNRLQRHRIKRKFLRQRRGGAKSERAVAPLRRCVSNFFLFLIINSSLVLFLRQSLAGHTIFALDPFPEVHKLTAFRTEGTERIVFPLDWLTAGWTLHESVMPRAA
jgi:hypothetical protein